MASRFLEFAKTFLSLKGDFGKSMSEAEMEATLSGLPLGGVVHALAVLTHRLDKLKDDKEFHQVLLSELAPGRIRPTVRAAVADGRRVFTSPHVSMRLTLRALMCCDASHLDLGLDRSRVPMLGRLLLAEGDLLESVETESQEETLKLMTVEMARTDLFLRSYAHFAYFEEAFHMFFEVMPRVETNERIVDPTAVFRERTGLELRAFWALGTTVAVDGLVREEPPVFPQAIGYGDLASPELYDRWLDYWGCGLEHARVLAGEDLAGDSPWSFDAIFEKPLLKLTPDTAFPLRTMYLAEKSTCTGLSWLVGDLIEDDKERKCWRDTCGRAFEAYMQGMVSDQLHGCSDVWDEDRISERLGGGKKCDLLAFYNNRAWLAADFVFRTLRKVTKVDGGFDALLTDLSRSVIEKADQMDDTLRRARLELPDPKRIYAIVVIGGAFPKDPMTHYALDQALRDHSFSVLGESSVCAPLAVMESYEFVLLMRLARLVRRPAFRLLDRWLSSDMSDMAFTVWLNEKGPKERPREDTEWLHKMAAWLFEP